MEHHRPNVAGQLFLKAGPLSYVLALHFEEKGGQKRTIQLQFPIAKPHDWLEGESRSGAKRNIRVRQE